MRAKRQFKVRLLMVLGCLSSVVLTHGAENVLNFNGSNARVTVNHAAHLSALSEITAEIWFKTATAKNQMPISKFNNNNQEWFVQLRDDGLTVRVGILTTKDFSLPARYDDNQWHHLAMTYDGSRIEVFYDGTSLGTQAHTAKILPPQQHGRVQLDPVRIGSGLTDWFVGQLAEVRIWNRARSGLKIRADMRRRLPGDLPGLVGYWRLDEGTGTTVADQTPYGVNGTIANTTWTTAGLDVSGFVVADIRAGGIYYTGSNEVRLARFPVPAGYTHFQITEDDDPGALGSWSSTSAVPDTVIFAAPAVNTNVMLYAWFTNTSDTVSLTQTVSRIVYTDVAPTAAARAALLPYRRLAAGGVLTVTGADIDNGSSGGEQDGLALDIAAWAAVCDGAPGCDTAPATPGITLDQPGTYTLRLIVTNEAGNTAQAALASTVDVVQSDVLYVSASGDHSAGTNWVTALTNVQWEAGLAGVRSLFDFVHDGDTVHLAGGTYKIGPRLAWTQDNLTVRGGYEGVGAPGAQDPALWPTTLTRDTAITTGIAGQILGGMAIDSVTGGLLDGVTITDAYNYNAGAWLNGAYNAAASYFEPGGNLLIRDSANVTVSRATFRDGFISANYAPCHGAGAAVVDSDNILLDACRILRNSAYPNRAYSTYLGGIQGIGLYTGNSSLTVTNSLIQANFQTSRVDDGYDTCGAGIYAGNGALHLLDSIVAGNYGFSRGDAARLNRGGGITIEGGTHRLWNCLVALNTLYSTRTPFDSYGDGLYVTGATLSIENSTIAQNSGQGIYSRTSSLAVTNSIVWGHHKDLDFVGNPDLFFHSNLGDSTYVGTNGCLSVDPRFERGFRLAPDSECLDVGGLTVAQAGLTGRTTQADGTPDSGNVDLGYHWLAELDPAVADLHVSVNGDDDAAGTPAAPLKTITEAIARADHGTRIHIEAGIYSRTVNGESFPLAIEHKFGIQLIGTNAAATIIDQELPGASNVNQWRVLTLQNTGGGTRIEGLTLTRGWSRHNLYYGTPGGGIGAWFSDFTVNGAVLTNNFCAWAAGSAGGLYAEGSMVLMTNTLIVNNQNDSDWESYGAGIHVMGDSRLTVVDSRITANKNHARQGSRNIHLHGAGVCISHIGQRWGGNTTFINSEIVDNYFSGKGDQFGAALASLGGNLLLRNCLVSGNVGNQDPAKTLVTGGVYIRGGTARIENCTVADNEAEGLGLFAANNPVVEVINTIIWGHVDDIGNLPAAAFSHSCASNLMAGVQDNLASNPRFADAVGGDYRLDGQSAVISPCINAGTKLGWMTGATDLAGEARIMGGRVDMGAYESIPPPGTLFLIR